MSCTKLYWSLELPTVDDVREMPYLPRNAHVDPVGVGALSSIASLHSIAIMEFVAARIPYYTCLFLLKHPPVAGVLESNTISGNLL